MDLTLADVPETKIEEFASSPMYDLYLNAFILFDLYDPIPSTMARTSEGEYLIDSSSITDLLSILLFMKDFTQYLPTSKREILEKSPEYRLFHEVIEYYKKL